MRPMVRFLIPPIAALAAMIAFQSPAAAQDVEAPAEEEEARATKWPKPDLKDVDRIRFVTDSDYPPFNYLDEEGTLTGFNVDLARLICDELAVECNIGNADWPELVPTLAKGEADAAIASIRVDVTALQSTDFTEAYYHTPARFITRKESGEIVPTPEGLKGKKVAVVEGTTHSAYLRAFFKAAELVPFDSMRKAKAALQDGTVDLLFGDGISLMFWLNGTASNGCCEFRGGPYTESKYFGEGIGIAVRRDDRKMLGILNYGLERVRQSARYDELIRRYFPLNIF